MDCRSPSQEYKNAQRNFYNWATKWAQCGATEKVRTPDLTEVISLMQAIGYKISFMDNSKIEDVLPLKIGGKGVRMVLTCTTSGLRACLEAQSECHCPNVDDASFWEVSGNAPKTTQNNIQETGSDILLPVSKGVQFVASQVMNHLFNMISTSTNSDYNQNDMKTPLKYTQHNTSYNKSQSNDSFGSYKSTTTINNIATSVNVLAMYPTIMIQSPEPPMSPARYRSLDALPGTTVNDIELPEPGILRKTSPSRDSLPIISHSSPNLSGSLSHPSGTSSPNINMKSDPVTLKKIKVAYDILKDVITLLEKNSTVTPRSEKDISRINASKESLIPKIPVKKKISTVPLASKIKPSKFSSSPNLTRAISTINKLKPIVKPQCRPPIRSISQSTISSINAKPIISKSGEPKKLNYGRSASTSEATTNKKPIAATKKKNLFSNVMSLPKTTIPKASTNKF